MAVKTREKLIEVARQLFVHKGVANTTMNDIANASAKGRRTIYTYFKNKKEIYNAVLETESDHMVTSLRTIAESSAPVEVRVAKFLRFRLENHNLQNSTTLKSWLKFDIRRMERISQMAHDKEKALLSALLEEGCKEGVFKVDRCKLLEGFIDQCINHLEVPRHNELDQEAADKAMTSFVEFILSDIIAEQK